MANQPPGFGAYGRPGAAPGSAPDGQALVYDRLIDGLRSLVMQSRPVGLGSRKIGDVSIWELAQYSPQLALARAQGVQLAPQMLNIRGSFVDSTNTLNPSSFDGPTNTSGNIAISQPTIIDQIVYEIDAPNAFTGNVFKSMSDYFYALQSGIQATMEVVGAPRYPVSPYFTPIRSLLSGLAEGWPIGWVLGYTQSIMMQFQQTIPVPTFPTNITVSFRMWQPIGTDEFQMMDAQTARNGLAALGISSPPAFPTPIVAR